MFHGSGRELHRQADELAAMIQAAGVVVVLTGAGVSTESDIPDFRGPDGLWLDHDTAQFAEIETFRRDPARTWNFYRQRLHQFLGVQPNPGHLALAKLEQLGLVDGIITQNVDGLHTAAGSELVLEVHGSLRHAVCLTCESEMPIEAAVGRFDPERNRLPRCESCASNPILKPGVVFFGERLAPAITAAYGLLAKCDLLLVCGTSLQVWPVSSMPNLVRDHGGKIVSVDTSQTGYPDADLTIQVPTGEFLPLVLQRLQSSSPSND